MSGGVRADVCSKSCSVLSDVLFSISLTSGGSGTSIRLTRHTPHTCMRIRTHSHTVFTTGMCGKWSSAAPLSDKSDRPWSSRWSGFSSSVSLLWCACVRCMCHVHLFFVLMCDGQWQRRLCYNKSLCSSSRGQEAPKGAERGHRGARSQVKHPGRAGLGKPWEQGREGATEEREGDLIELEEGWGVTSQSMIQCWYFQISAPSRSPIFWEKPWSHHRLTIPACTANVIKSSIMFDVSVTLDYVLRIIYINHPFQSHPSRADLDSKVNLLKAVSHSRIESDMSITDS